MALGTYQISLSFSQIKELVKQLSNKDKLSLSRDLEVEIKEETLTQLLESFKSEEISQKEIDLEVESVRAEIYAKSKKY